MHPRTMKMQLMVVALAIFATVGVLGCATGGNTQGGSGASTSMSGAQVWAANCGRCHNFRSPSQYNDAQWAVIVHQMRVRVPLTGEQQRAVTEYLQAIN